MLGSVLHIKQVVWEGDSRKVLQLFPDEVRRELGVDLFRVQQGREPDHFRPMPSVGTGVFELKQQDARGWYRLIYYTQVKDRIYVLHAFEKRSRKTSKQDLRTVEIRLKRVQQRVREGRI